MKSGINSREGLDVPICKIALFSGINAINRCLVTVTHCVSRDVRNRFFYFGSFSVQFSEKKHGIGSECVWFSSDIIVIYYFT